MNGDVVNGLKDMQYLWALDELCRHHIRHRNISEVRAISGHILDMIQTFENDVYDFHSYSVRKVSLHAYSDVVKVISHLGHNIEISNLCQTLVLSSILCHEGYDLKNLELDDLPLSTHLLVLKYSSQCLEVFGNTGLEKSILFTDIICVFALRFKKKYLFLKCAKALDALGAKSVIDRLTDEAKNVFGIEIVPKATTLMSINAPSSFAEYVFFLEKSCVVAPSDFVRVCNECLKKYEHSHHSLNAMFNQFIPVSNRDGAFL